MAGPVSCLSGGIMLLLPTILLSLLVQSSSQLECVFPKYLQYSLSGSWLQRVHQQGTQGQRRNFMKLIFQGGVMKSDVNAGVHSNHIQKAYAQTCLNATTNGAYIVERVVEGANNSFLCLEFYRQSDSVVLLRLSASKMLVENVTCNELYTEQWPMVTENIFNEGQRVPSKFAEYIGGFDLELQGSAQKDWQTSCNVAINGPPFMELACLPRDIIKINFHTRQCIPQELLMSKNSNLQVLAVWMQFDFVFLVLRMKHNLWCVRIDKANKVALYMVIFLDLVCDSTSNFSEGQNQITFKMSHRRTNLSPPVPKGDLDQRFHGLWYHMDGFSTVNITTSTVYFPEQGEYKYAGNGQAVMPGGLVRVPLHSSVSNGCSAKMTCLEIGLQSRSVVKYRLAQVRAIVDDGTLSDPHGELCTDKEFDATEDYIFKHVIRVNKNLTDLSVACALFKPNPKYTFFLVKDEERCYGNLKVPCGKPNELTIAGTNIDCEITSKIRSQHCLASFETKLGERILITSAVSSTIRFSCWIFKTEKDLFYLPQTDCNEETVHQYELAGKKADSMQILKLNNVDQTCPTHIPSPPTTTTKTSKPTATPNIKSDNISIIINQQNNTIDDKISASPYVKALRWPLLLIHALLCAAVYW